MPHELSWYAPAQRIIVGRAYGQFTLQDILDWNKQVWQLLDEGTAPIHLLVDFTQGATFTVPFWQIRQTMRYVQHPALGWTATFGGSLVINTFGRIVAELSGVRYNGFKTQAGALAFLIHQDGSLRAGIGLPPVQPPD